MANGGKKSGKNQWIHGKAKLVARFPCGSSITIEVDVDKKGLLSQIQAKSNTLRSRQFRQIILITRLLRISQNAITSIA